MKYFDDDMDDLFNKAGRQYPLKTDPKNWDAVRAALAVEQDAAASAVKPSRKYRRYLPLLLLLLIPAVYVMVDKDNVRENDAVVTPAVAVETNNKKSGGSDKPSDRTASEKQSQTNADNSRSATTQLPILKKEKNKFLNISSLKTEAIAPAGGVSNDNDYTQQTNVLSPRASRLSAGNALKPFSKSPETIKTSFPNPYQTIKTTKPNSLVQPNESGSVPNSAKTKQHKGGLYYGITAGPDATTIKGQKIQGIGYSAGVIVGYNVNPKLAIEGGILWSNKKYFTKGKYFSKEGANIPPSVDVRWLDGGCNMLEFPISVRYSFKPKRNTFFIGGGLTSYLMKKEDYDYGAVVLASNYYYEGYRTYDRSGDHLFANVQLSGGYKFGLTSKLNVRIEPYLKAPLKKIGIGKMPITSTGLYFSITRDLR